MTARILLITVLLTGLATARGQAQTEPEPLEDRLNQAIELAESGQMDDAVAALEALRDDPEWPVQATALLGALYLEAGRPGDALATLTPLAEAEDANPAVLYNAGRAAIAAGDRARAQAFLRRSVEMAPGSPAARALGLELARQGRFPDAYIQLKPWATANPDDTEARQIAALCAVQLERPNEAEELLSDLPQDQPLVRLLWGKVLLLKADPWGALATLKPLLEDGPEAMQLDVRRSVAEAHAAVGDAASAVEVLEGHVKGNASIALQLGQAMYQSGDLDSAIATLQPFADRLGDAARQGTMPSAAHELALIVEYGRLLVTAGRHQQAIPFLELATGLDPNNKQSWHQLGQALAASDRREEARVALERFQEIVQNEVPASLRDVQLEKDLEDPTGRELRQAMTLLADGRTEEALAIARREMAVAPQDIRPRLVEARVLFVAERLGEALQAADNAVQAAPGSGDAYYIRGTVLMGMQEFEAAEKDLRTALEAAPDHTAAMNDLAVLLMERGDTDEARQLLERALELRPDDALAADNLKRLESPAG